ncbi:MAG: hypothetical protein ACRBK7_19815 [Acidimicrobiales bacterium]
MAIACSDLDAELVIDWSAETEQSLVEADIDDDVVGCVLDMASDDLERGPVSELAIEELVLSCRTAWLAVQPGEEDVVPDTELALTDVAWAFGDDPALDRLWTECEEGLGAACDELFDRSELGSVYEDFGVSCGDRPEVLYCSELDAEPDE